MNRVVLVGRLTKDPELRRTQTGVPVTSFTLAINRTYTAPNGERQADFIPCVVWNKAAENVARYTTKGALVGVEGRIQSRNYQGQDGKMVYVVEVNCDSVQFLESKNSRDQRPNMSQSMPDNTMSNNQMNAQQIPAPSFDDDFSAFDATFDISDDDIPF